MAKQGQAKQQEMEQSEMEQEQKKAQQILASLAQVFSGMGMDVDPSAVDALSQNPAVMKEFLERSRPQEPRTTETSAHRQGTGWIAVLRRHPGESAPGVEAPETGEPDAKTIKGADGFNYCHDRTAKGTKGVARGGGPRKPTSPLVNVNVNPKVEKSTKRQLDEASDRDTRRVSRSSQRI